MIDANPGQLRPKGPLFGWFIGQVMKSTAGANPKVVNELLKKALDAYVIGGGPPGPSWFMSGPEVRAR